MTVTVDLFSFLFGFTGGVICAFLLLCLIAIGSVQKAKPCRPVTGD